ncbi:ethanolamine utilization protein EutH [Klebsiella pneumoniae]
MQAELQTALFHAFDTLNLQQMKSFNVPPVTLHGVGALAACGPQAQSRGLRHLFVMVDSFLHQAGMTAGLERSLAMKGIAMTLWPCPAGEPCVTDVCAAVAQLRDARCDGVVAFGGGSVLDAAKAVALLVANPEQTLGEMTEHSELRPRLPLIAVPTTAGTGSETTNVTVIIDAVSGRKQVLAHASLMPDVAIIVAVLVALGLKFIPEKMINGFQIFAKFLVALITIGLAAAVIKFLLGWELIPGLDPIFMAPGDQPGEVMRAIEVIGSISCVLLGAYPMVLLLTRWFEKPLMRVGNLLKINNMAAGGMVATLANNIPMFGMMKQMDTRGKVINCAFSVSAAFALGDHLGFAAANMNAMIFPMIVGKLVGGVTAIGVAMLLVPKDENVPAPANNEAEAHS